MIPVSRWTITPIAIVLALGLAFGAQPNNPSDKCVDLISASFAMEAKIVSASRVPASGGIPEYCDVRGTIAPEVIFAIKLPTNWNRRFYMVGNGGLAGTINVAAMDVALRRGFATGGTDTGHHGPPGSLDDAIRLDGTFARPGPDNPNATRKVTDFLHQAVHETAVLGKEILKTFYGEPPRYSYWAGCSTGGRQGLIEAQRFPEDFDGYVVGAPVLDFGTTWRHVWNARAQTGPGTIAVQKLPLLADAVYKKCDAIDGLEDGLIDDPRNCTFDPAADLPRCPADTDGPSCFTSAQTDALKKIYTGLRDSSGKLLFPGQPVGAEVLAPASDGTTRSGWNGTIAGDSVGLKLAESYMKYLALDPPAGSAWDYRSVDFDVDLAKTKTFAAAFNATDPDLTALRQRGGRIIHYHGWADPSATALMSIDYYESVRRKMGTATPEFYRLFLIPGMFHCGGGVGCDSVDWLTAIVDWVEKGVPPDRLTGARLQRGAVTRTRPLCPYPATATYKGLGSIDSAESFACRTLRGWRGIDRGVICPSAASLTSIIQQHSPIASAVPRRHAFGNLLWLRVPQAPSRASRFRVPNMYLAAGFWALQPILSSEFPGES
jgi:feruloyl esterase